MQTLRHTSIATEGDLVERAERQERRRRATIGRTVARHTNILALAAALLLALAPWREPPPSSCGPPVRR